MTIKLISARGSEPPESVARQTASRETLPFRAGDDFGLLRAICTVLATYAVIVLVWLACMGAEAALS